MLVNRKFWKFSSLCQEVRHDPFLKCFKVYYALHNTRITQVHVYYILMICKYIFTAGKSTSIAGYVTPVW